MVVDEDSSVGASVAWYGSPPLYCPVVGSTVVGSVVGGAVEAVVVGGVVVVGRLGLSTDESLLELRDQLDNLEAPILGVVLNAESAPGVRLHNRVVGPRDRP